MAKIRGGVKPGGQQWRENEDRSYVIWSEIFSMFKGLQISIKWYVIPITLHRWLLNTIKNVKDTTRRRGRGLKNENIQKMRGGGVRIQIYQQNLETG